MYHTHCCHQLCVVFLFLPNSEPHTDPTISDETRYGKQEFNPYKVDGNNECDTSRTNCTLLLRMDEEIA